jgi:predicted HicB family RNase H-like nuclease
MASKKNLTAATLNVRISPIIKELLEKRAKSLGISASEYVRMLIMEDARHLIDECPDAE